MEYKNPEYTDKIIGYQLQQISKGISWIESIRQLAQRAGITDFNPDNISEKQQIEMAKHI